MIPSRRTLLSMATLGTASVLTRGAEFELVSRAHAEGSFSGRAAWSFQFEGLDGPAIRLSEHAGKPVLVVNTASYCGFASQFSKLQALWMREGPRGLLVVGVPSGDFGGQEADDAATIRSAASSHGVTFPMAAKSHVVGSEAHPFYRWAAAERPRETPRWNFHKYVVGADGRLAAVFPTPVQPDDSRLLAALAKELAAAG